LLAGTASPPPPWLGALLRGSGPLLSLGPTLGAEARKTPGDEPWNTAGEAACIACDEDEWDEWNAWEDDPEWCADDPE
jgi:hypothetical protein